MNDLDDKEAADEDDDEEGDEDCQSERSAGSIAQKKPPQQSTTNARKKDQTQQKDVEVSRPTSVQKTHRVNTARIAQMSEEEERLSEYLIEAHALKFEPQGWRQTLNNEGTAEHRMEFYKALDSNLKDRRRKIDWLQHLILEISEPYTKYTRVNEVMLKLRGMKRADDEIWQNLVKCLEKCDVDRPLSRLQRCIDKYKHQIRTWMEKLFHMATWEMSEQAYHEAIINMMDGDVGAQAFRQKDLSLQDIIDTLIAKYDTMHRTPEDLNEELRKIKREKHQSPYQFRQVIESMFKQMIAVQPIPESDAQLRVLLRERLLANVGEKTKGKLEKLMARCHQSGWLATVNELYECSATSEAIKKDWVKGRASKVSLRRRRGRLPSTGADPPAGGSVERSTIRWPA